MKNHQTKTMRFLIIVTMTLIGCYFGLTSGRTASARSADQAGSPRRLCVERLPSNISSIKGLDHSPSAGLTAVPCQMVGEEGAIDPAMINPTFTQQQKLVAADAMGGHHVGYSVAISGETAVVGRVLDDGAVDTDTGSAYVFVRSGGVWNLQQKLVASDAEGDDDFGISVAISGETIVVGTLRGDSAYVFLRSGGVWTEQQKLVASDPMPGGQFGCSVAINGETVVVGARRYSGAAGIDQGSAYVFARNGGVWTQQQKLEASDAVAGEQIGFSVAVSGDTVVVGAPGNDGAAGVDQGSAYVFVRNGEVWTQQQKLEAADAMEGDFFGNSVTIRGETIVVGAPGDLVASIGPGSAYVFMRSGEVWSQQQKLEAADGSGRDFFGDSVAISGESVVVGARFDDGAAGIDQGSAYVFVRNGGVWAQQQKLEAADAAQSDQFGVRWRSAERRLWSTRG